MENIEDKDIKVTDRAIIVNGAQDSWALAIHKLDYLWECLENTSTVIEDVNDANAFGPDENGEYPSFDIEEGRSLVNDEEDVAWR